MSQNFCIKVYKQYFNFAAAHFMIFDNGTREPLHGHNYRVMVKANTHQLQNDMVFDFLDLKPIVREICHELDHKLIIPKDHPLLKLEMLDREVKIILPDQTQMTLPQVDVLLLPITNTSAERFAIYINQEVRTRTQHRFKFSFSSLEVEVEETPGQSAVYEHTESL